MTVDFLEEEMNILNLNGLSVQDVTDNVNYLRMTGLDDKAIRSQYDELLSELRPITKTDSSDTQKIQEWNSKGAITPFEYGQRKSVVFDGTYNNIDSNANLSALETKLKNSDYNNTVEQRIANQKRAKEERNKRVNEGNASFVDRVGAALDRWGNASLQAQIDNNKQDLPIGSIEQRKNDTGKIDFSESLQNSFENMSWLPYVGGFLEEADTQKEREIRKHILNGEPIRQDELDFLNKRLEEFKENKVRGYTIGGEIAKNLLPSVARFGLEMATGGWILNSLGFAPKLANGANFAQKVQHGVKTMAATGAVNTLNPLTGANEIYSVYQQRMNENELSLSDDGKFIFQESKEKPNTAFLKSMQQVFIMFASEAAGGLIGLPLKGVSAAASKFVVTPISKYLKQNQKLVDFVKKTVPALSKKYEEMNNLPVRGTNVDWLKEKVKFDGFIEELGEEVLEDVLNLTFGTNNEERSLENYSKAIFKSPDEWAVLMGAIALQGTSLSVASHIIGSRLEANGATNEEIQEVMSNLSEDDKRKVIEQLISSSNIELGQVRTEEEQKLEEQSNQVKDNVFKLLVEKGFDEEQADSYSRLFKARSKMVAKNWGDVNAIDWLNNLGLQIDNEQQKTLADGSPVRADSVSYEQSAMYASKAKNFDEFYNKVLSSDKNIKSKEQYNLKTKGNNYFRIPFDTVLHDKNGHSLTKEQWNEFLENIDNPIDFEISSKPRFAGKPILLKVKTNSAYYGAVIETFEKNNPIITTVFKDTEKNIDNWLKKERPSQTRNTSAVTTKGLLLSKGLTNIITNVQPNYNPNVKYNEQYLRSENIGSEVSKINISQDTKGNTPQTLTDNNTIPQQTGNLNPNVTNLEENTFYQSAYHGTPHKFDEFSTDNIGTGEGAQVHGWGLYFAENKDVSENYRKKLAQAPKGIHPLYKQLYINGGKANAIKYVQDNLNTLKQAFNNAKTENEKKEYSENIKNLEKQIDIIEKFEADNLGQLFEVDIPENDVLLDEDKTIEEQSPQVKKAIQKYFNNATEDKLKQVLDFLGIKTGKDFYNNVASNAFDKYENGGSYNDIVLSAMDNLGKYKYELASKILNQLGIKGITYDGRQDGRCYVVFDDKAISVLQTFYQEGKNHTQLQRKDGGIVDVEYYNNSDIKNVKPLNIRKLKFANVQNAKEIKKSDIKNNILNDKNTINIKNKKTNINAVLTKSSIDKMFSDLFKTKGYEHLRKEIIVNVETIFENAIPVLKHNELKNENLYDKQIIHRFALPVQIGGNNFLTMITVKERTDNKERQIDEFTIYNLISQNKRELDSSSQGANAATSHNQTLKYSMTDIIDFVNSNLNKYKVTLNQGSNNQNQPDFTENIFGEKKVNIDSKEAYDNFIDNFSSEETRAAITFENNALNSPKAIIHLFENADKSSFLHEVGHLFLQDIINAAKTNEYAKRELEAINKMLGHTQGEYTRAEHEKFAKGFEIYLMNGKAPNAGLKSAFDTFKSWLREIYNFVLASNGALSQDVYSVYDSLFKDYNPDDMEVVHSIVRNALHTSNNAIEGRKSSYLTKTQKRYKETAYDILTKALGKNKTYLKNILENKATKKNAKAREKIENKIANISDEISSSDGMLPEWKEFFADNNIGDNSETKSDYELVQKAYDVIVNKSYQDYDEGSDYNYYSREIDPDIFEKYEKAYNYILDIYRNGNEKQKDYAVAAMYDWLDSCLIGELYEEIFTEMFEQDFQELERIANLDKFGKAKEKISNAAKMLSYSDTKNFNKLVIETLKSLDFLTSKDKTIILSNLMQYKTTEEIRNNLDEIMDIAKILDSQNYFNRVETKIQKALKGTKNVKQGNKTVGKYTKEINDVFADLRRFNNMTQERATQELEAMNMFEGEETDSLSFEDKLRRKFLYYKATPNMYISSDFISDLYKDILTLKNYGYLKKEQDKFMRKVNIDSKIEKLLRVLDKKKKGGFKNSSQNENKENDIKIKPINIENDSVPNFEKISDLKGWIIEKLNLLGNVNIKSNNRTVNFSKSNIGRSMKGISRNEVKRNSYASLRELVENAIYGYAKETDNRHSERNNGQEIYYNAFTYNGEIYGIEVCIDIPKQNNTPYTYAGHKIKIIKMVSAATRIGSKELTSNSPDTISGITEVSSNEGLLDSTDTNISITDVKKLFNPKIERQVLYDLSSVSSTLNTDTNIITNNRSNFKVDDKKLSSKLIGGYIRLSANWESALNAIFNNDIKEEYSLLDKEAEVQVWQNQQKQEFLNEAMKIFGVNQYKFDNLMIDKLAEKFTFVEYGAKRTHKIEMNKMDIILAYIWSKNPNLKERLERQFTQQGLYDMFSNLDNEEIEFANLLQKTASKFYNEANKVYIQKYGIELPRVQNYFPSKTERTSVVDLLADFSFQSAASPSFIKNRVVSNMPTMKFSNPLTLLFSHIDKMGVFIKMTETIDLYNKVFTDTDIKKTITELYGKETYESFATTLANSSYQKQAVKTDGLTKIFNTMVNNFVSSKIILKPSIMIKQLFSTVNYAENMPVTTWCSGFLKAVSNPKATIDFMMSDEYLKTRFTTGGQNEYLKQVIENSQFAKTRKLIDYLSLNVKIGDIGAIIFGGKPYIDYLMNVKGMTKEAAFKEFRLSTMRSQQASMASSLSNFQNNFNNPFVRGLFSFRNTPNQYFRKVADSIISYANGDTSKSQMAKTIFIYTFVNAFMYNTATSLSLLAFALNGGGDDDDLKQDIIKSFFDFNSQAVPILGDLYTYVLERIMGASRKGDVSIPAITDIFDAIQNLTAEDVTLEDWINELATIADITTGLPVQTTVNMAGGVGDIAQGNVASGALRTVGYTKKRSQKTTGEED